VSILFSGARKLDAEGQVDDFWMLVDGDTITATGSGAAVPRADERIDVGGKWLAPGFIDLHVHGGGGHSFDGDAESMLSALRMHRAHGTTRSLVSLVANPIDALCRSLAAIADLVDSDPLVLGSHLEGPFLSPQRPGAHEPAHLHPPVPSEVEKLLGASRDTLRVITIAPELPGAGEAIDVLVEAGVTVAVGHTEATFEVAKTAFDRGARMLTHLFNAMPGIHHRSPGPAVAAFEDDRVIMELVLDGHHVHPDVAALAFTAAPGRVALVTDAMSAAGSADGEYRLGSLDVTVENGLAYLTGTTTIASSTLTQDEELRRAMRLAGISPVDAVTALTATPSRAIGLGHRHGRLAPGFAADAVLLDHSWQVTHVWANGERI
jgi:N-acetylglucosamine-6-phosphate deacetylase